jgi:hypothetical protein
MAKIYLRTGPSGEGAPLSLEQVDANFTNINVELGQKLNITDYTATDVYNKVLSINNSGKAGINAITVTGIAPNTAVPSTTDKTSLVVRDSLGNINGATITASTQFTGNVVGNVTGNLTGNADTSTRMAMPVNINGVAFDGSASIQVRDNNKVLLAGDTMTGFLTLSAAPTANMHAANKQYVDQYGCPKGAIIMWYGATLPYGWGFCDGTLQTPPTGGSAVQTPDLRSKFIYGSYTLAESLATGGGSSVTTSTAGTHQHSGATGSYTLTTNDIPTHTHQFYDVYAIADDVGNGNYTITGGVPQYAGMPGASGSYNRIYDVDGHSVSYSFYLNDEYADDADQAAYAFKNVTLANGNPTPGSHYHSISSDGSHNHTVTGFLPPYIKLAYIIKLI